MLLQNTQTYTKVKIDTDLFYRIRAHYLKIADGDLTDADRRVINDIEHKHNELKRNAKKRKEFAALRNKTPAKRGHGKADA